MADSPRAAERLESAEQSLALLRTAFDSYGRLSEEQSIERRLALLTDVLGACEDIERLQEPSELVLMDSRLLAASARLGLASMAFRTEEQLVAAVHQCTEAARAAYEAASFASEANTLRSSLELLLGALSLAEETVARSGFEESIPRGSAEDSDGGDVLVDSILEAIKDQTLRLRLVMDNADREQQMGLDLVRMEKDLVVLATSPNDEFDQRDVLTEARVLAEAAEERFFLAGDEAMLAEVRADLLSIDEAVETLGDSGLLAAVGTTPEVRAAPPSAPPSAAPAPASAQTITAAQPAEAWFYLTGAAQRGGPLPRKQLETLLGRGELPADTLVWKAGMPEWRRTHEAGLVAAASPSAPAEAPPAGPAPASAAPLRAAPSSSPAAHEPAAAATAPAPAAPREPAGEPPRNHIVAAPIPAAKHEPAAADLKESWYLGRHGERFGPYTLEQVRGFVWEGRVAPGDLVWHPTLPAWMTLEEVRARAPGLV